MKLKFRTIKLAAAFFCGFGANAIAADLSKIPGEINDYALGYLENGMEADPTGFKFSGLIKNLEKDRIKGGVDYLIPILSDSNKTGNPTALPRAYGKAIRAVCEKYGWRYEKFDFLSDGFCSSGYDIKSVVFSAAIAGHQLPTKPSSVWAYLLITVKNDGESLNPSLEQRFMGRGYRSLESRLYSYRSDFKKFFDRQNSGNGDSSIIVAQYDYAQRLLNLYKDFDPDNNFPRIKIFLEENEISYKESKAKFDEEKRKADEVKLRNQEEQKRQQEEKERQRRQLEEQEQQRRQEAQRKEEAAKQAKLEAWRKTIKVGDDTFCGPIIELRQPMVRIAIKVPLAGYPSEAWLKSSELYPDWMAGCRNVNGQIRPMF